MDNLNSSTPPTTLSWMMCRIFIYKADILQEVAFGTFALTSFIPTRDCLYEMTGD